MTDSIVDYQFRLIVIGDYAVGKSSFLKYFTYQKFSELPNPTIGVDFFTHTIEIKPHKMIKLHVWDTAGQERFKAVIKSFYKNAAGVLLLYDICSRTSFEHISEWMMEAVNYIKPYRPVFMLVGCKSDLVTNDDTRRKVSTEEAKAFADQHNMHHVETSAKTGVNVEEVFRTIAQEIYNRNLDGEYNVDGWEINSIGVTKLDDSKLTILEATTAESWCC